MSGAGFQILITNGAKDDLIRCKARDPDAAAHISTHLRELAADAHRCACLADEHYSDELIESVVPLWDLQRRRMNAYRVRYILLDHWRVITAVDHPAKQIAIMAIMLRRANYQQDRDLWSRIEREYDGIGLARLGR
jgi:hypothetical protein